MIEEKDLSNHSISQNQPQSNLCSINYGESHAWLNKDRLPGFDFTEAQTKFTAVRKSPAEFVEHVLSGGKYTPAIFENGYRDTDHWLQAELPTIDYDQNVSIADLLAIEFVREKALVIYSTPSSSPAEYRTRVVFRLSEPLYTPEQYKAVVQALIAEIGLPADPASVTAAQPFAGSTNRVEQPHINLEAVLPLELVGGLCYEQALNDMLADLEAPPRMPLDPDDSRAGRISARAYDRLLNKLAAAQDGNRNRTLNEVAYAMFCKSLGGWPDFDEQRIEQDLEAIYGRWPNKRKSRGTVKSAKRKAQPEPLTLLHPLRKDRRPVDQRVRETPVDLAPFTSHETVNLRYISDLDLHTLAGYTGIVIKSGIGTGKTELVQRVIERLERHNANLRVLVITHRVRLVTDIAHRYGFPTYRDFQGDNRSLIAAAPQMVITYNSLYRLDSSLSYDVVIIDEVEQFHPQVTGDTFRGGDAARAYKRLCQIVQDAGLLLAMDAHVSDVTGQWVEAMKGAQNVLKLENAYQQQRGGLTIHRDYSTVYTRALAVLREHPTGFIAVPCTTPGDALAAETLFAEAVDADQVVTVYGDNSDDPAVQDFIDDINHRLADIRVLIYTGSLGTGVDIRARALGVFGIFRNQPTTAADHLQAMGRCRHANERHAYVQDARGNRITDAAELYRLNAKTAAYTAAMGDFAQHGLVAMRDIEQEIERLQASYKAERNRMLNAPLAFFAALARAEGYTLAYENGVDKALRDALTSARQDLKNAAKQARLTNAAVTTEAYEQHRRNQTITPAIRAGHERFIIEDAVGLTITPTIHDDLDTSQKRAALRRFTNLGRDGHELAAEDRAEAERGILPQRRTHSKQERTFFELFCKQVFECQSNELASVLIDVSADTIAEKMDGFIELNGEHLTRLYGWRPAAHSHNPVAVVRWLLNKYGLKLDRKQVMQDGRRFMVYSLNLESWQRQKRYGGARLAHLKHKAMGDYYKPAKDSLSRNVVMRWDLPPTPHLVAQETGILRL